MPGRPNPARIAQRAEHPNDQQFDAVLR